MDTNLIFEDTLLDELSSTPTQHLTYILKHLLPVRLIGRHRLEKVDSEFYLKGVSQDADDDVIVMPVGSLAEALNMPPVILKNEKEVKGDYYTDIDLMFIAKIPALTFDQKRVLSDKHLVLVETDGIHPGYARLYKSENYVNNSTFQNDIKSSITGIYADIATEVNGPAVTTPKVVDMTLQNFHRSTASGSNPMCPTDHVMALASKEWPDIADAWKTRKRSNGWLSEEIIISLTSGGCHVVPVPHRSSMSPDIEWRISFTYTERRIAREVLTDHQRQGYITLKLIYNHALKNLDIISSYHLKTIFFYACETIPILAWEENIGTCVLYMLDLLLECLSKNRIPNYFVPENNMIDYLTDDDTGSMMDTVMNIRINPIKAILDFTENKIIGMSSVLMPFREIVGPVVKDIPSFLHHKDIRRSILESFSISSLHGILVQLHEKKTDEAVHIATDLHSILVRSELTKHDLDEFLYVDVTRNIKNVELAVQFLECIVRANNSGYECCRNNIPNVYHLAAHQYPDHSSERALYLQKAETAFSDRILDNFKPGIACDYALLLLDQGRIDSAISLLKKTVRENNSSDWNVYDKKDRMILDTVLQEELDNHPPLHVSSIAFAYYLLDTSLNRLNGNDKERNDSLHEFKQFSLANRHSRTFSLLGYCCISANAWQDGSDAFQCAIDTSLQEQIFNQNRGYTLAVKMKTFCDHKLGNGVP